MQLFTLPRQTSLLIQGILVKLGEISWGLRLTVMNYYIFLTTPTTCYWGPPPLLSFCAFLSVCTYSVTWPRGASKCLLKIYLLCPLSSSPLAPESLFRSLSFRMSWQAQLELPFMEVTLFRDKLSRKTTLLTWGPVLVNWRPRLSTLHAIMSM